MRLLSTRTMRTNFKDQLIQSGAFVTEHSFIKVEPISSKVKKVKSNLIFTSQNAVNFVFESIDIIKLIKGKNCFCVGEKTKSLLIEKGLNVLKMTQNASDLAHFLIKNHKKDSFSFFCGKQRRQEIETLLEQNKIAIDIQEIYKTSYTSKRFETRFDGILFFSPSAVSSYFTKNLWDINTHGFCIGSSTAQALSQFTSNFSQAKSPSENQLLLTILQYYAKK
tara:strand:+ start:861 stop:1526 length:666 start_codon:yes stop_codon:yes gene_type:complete